MDNYDICAQNNIYIICFSICSQNKFYSTPIYIYKMKNVEGKMINNSKIEKIMEKPIVEVLLFKIIRHF